MRSAIVLFFCMALGSVANAQQNYDVSLIPKELTAHANAVVRDQEISVNVEDLDNTIVHKKLAVTIFNKNGDDMARIYIEHDKSTIIKSVKGMIYNEFGKPANKFSEGDFEDHAAWDGFSLFLDTRVKYYYPSVTQYPYTIEYEYELRLKQSLEFPDWEPNPYFGVAVEKSAFNFSCRPEFPIRYKETNINAKLNVSNSKGLKTYTWQVTNLKAIKSEPYSPYPGIYLSRVKIAPEKFSYYGVTGSFQSWEELGKWNYDKLVSNRQQLPEETLAHVKEMTEDITDPKLKAKKVYEYMQHKTHYVSVQVGIGGYQPFLASDVDKQNYGDCKALVSYTQALLKAVGIESYYCVVKSGRSFKVSMLNDFPSMDQGDHIILCVPFKNDTTWADCTSQTIPFGYLGDFTDDRDVLACTPEGGKLLHTPRYTADANSKSRKASFIIAEDGWLSGNMVTTLKGCRYEDRDELVNETRTEQVKILQHVYPINNLEVETYDLKQDKSFDPSTTENIKLKARDYASLTGGKLYFMLNSLDRVEEKPRQVRNRLNPVYINRGLTDIDEVTYTIPAGYSLEKEPLNVSVDKPFGKFTATMTLNGNQITYKRKFQLIDGTYSKETYDDLVNFYQDVADADDYTVSLKKTP